MARILIGKNMLLRRLTERQVWLRNLLWRIEAWLFAGFLLLARRLPASTATGLSRGMLSWLGPKQAKHRHVRRNLELAFPDKPAAEIERLGAGVWGNMGAIFAEYAQLEAICEERLESVVAPEIETFRNMGRQAVFVSAHFCNWEILAAAITRLGVPVTAVYTPLQNPWLDRILARQRCHLGCRLIARDESMRPLLRELAAGRSIGLVMDQRVDSGTPIAFFGIDKLTTLIPARLALRRNCELVACMSERLADGRFRVTFFPPVTPEDPQADELVQAEQMSRKVNAYFENWIRARPADWYCTKRRWPKGAQAAGCDPIGAASTTKA
jgi:KDO2-lipid IV(A) lauroyltransferase